MIGKLFGAGLGWVIGGGPIGAIIGYAIGNMFDKSNKKDADNKGKHRSNPADFSAVLVVASAAVMKADGKILKAELDFVKNFFVKQFGEEIAKEKIILLREVLKQDIPIHEVAHQIKNSMLIAEKRLLLQYLFGIALSDGSIDREELTVIEQLAYGMGISTLEFMRMKAMFVGYTQGQYNSGQQNSGGYRPQQVPLNQYYDILGVSSSATNDEIKKAYRKLAVQNHPDKVAHLGEEHVKNAQEKFKKIQEAYDAINKSRGVK